MKCNFKVFEETDEVLPGAEPLVAKYDPPICSMKNNDRPCDGEENCILHASRLIETEKRVVLE